MNNQTDAWGNGGMNGLPPRLMKEPAARAYLGGMSHGAFYRLRQAGAILERRVGRSVYYDRGDLDDFAASLAASPKAVTE